MTKKEKLIVTAYTGILMVSIDDFCEYVEQLLGRQIFTHEYASHEIWEEIKEASKEDFVRLCRE